MPQEIVGSSRSLHKRPSCIRRVGPQHEQNRREAPATPPGLPPFLQGSILAMLLSAMKPDLGGLASPAQWEKLADTSLTRVSGNGAPRFKPSLAGRVPGHVAG